jgi:hypothetical protein
MIIHTPIESTCRVDKKNAFLKKYPAKNAKKRVSKYILLFGKGPPFGKKKANIFSLSIYDNLDTNRKPLSY